MSHKAMLNKLLGMPNILFKFNLFNPSEQVFCISRFPFLFMQKKITFLCHMHE